LKKDVVLVGEGRFIEIFAKEHWQEVAQQAEEGFDQIRDTLANLGI
ncbi:MAG: cell division/cell wall cluster transcriptional repressor MraZ, partial [Deltaproteobacteria bacterium]|nr:cell division/cell wall cluster transcriptional repressor MraZ [Deltaproteobacteria bacterium]